MNSYAADRKETGKAIDFLQLFDFSYSVQNDEKFFLLA